MTESIHEILLSREELVYLLRSGNAQGVAGMKIAELELEEAEVQKISDQGRQSLKARGLVGADNLPQADLLNMADVVGQRDLAVILARGVRAYGQQLFVYNLLGDDIVEHTLPEVGIHRWMSLDSLEAFFKRIQDFVPLAVVNLKDRVMLSINQADVDFLRLNVNDKKWAEARQRLSTLGAPADWVEPLLAAMGQPFITLSMAILLLDAGEVVSGTSAAIFADEGSSWGIWPGEKEGQLLLFPTGITDLFNAIADALEESAGVD
jgi:hypothetical protein